VPPDWFAELLTALREPGLSIVLEGPTGCGKTTLLHHALEAIEQDAPLLRRPRTFTARDPGDIAAIADLVSGGDHQGIVAIDDFHRLPAESRNRVADYLALLADRGDRSRKLIIAGIPDTQRSPVRASLAAANQTRQFRLGWAPDRQVIGLIEHGEKALNVAFDDKAALVKASSGSLMRAQSLCQHLLGLARIERTLPKLGAVPTDIDWARRSAFGVLKLKYSEPVMEFVLLDYQETTTRIDLLLALAAEPEAVLYLDTYADRHPGSTASIEKALAGLANAIGPASDSDSIRRVLHYDSQGRRLIADDPQFVFYIRHLYREELIQEVGQRPPLPRSRALLYYRFANSTWLKRLPPWPGGRAGPR
jgi:hypothetical protein